MQDTYGTYQINACNIARALQDKIVGSRKKQGSSQFLVLPSIAHFSKIAKISILWHWALSLLSMLYRKEDHVLVYHFFHRSEKIQIEKF